MMFPGRELHYCDTVLEPETTTSDSQDAPPVHHHKPAKAVSPLVFLSGVQIGRAKVEMFLRISGRHKDPVCIAGDLIKGKGGIPGPGVPRLYLRRWSLETHE
jgi:hypothetical protein